MKKILMFQDYFDHGGIEKVILDIKNNINNNYKIDILTMVNKSNEKVVSLVNKNNRSFFIRNIKGIKKYQKYLKVNKDNYDIIHIHCYNAFGLIYAYIAKKYYQNIIVHAHNSGIDNDVFYIKHFVNSIIKLLFKSNKYKYLAVSHDSNKFCFNVKNTVIIPNGIDYQKYYFNKDERNHYRKKFSISDNDIVIGHIGRFEKQKNHQFIIDIFNEINKKKNNYKLVLIGEGKLKKKIINKINKLKLDVIILDNRNDIPKLINMFDIYMFPSILEGFGLSVVENLVNGKYVFASDILSRDVKISNRLCFISLKEKASYWANKIINLKEKELQLNNRLDIVNYINNIEHVYRGFYEKTTKI